MGMAVSSKICSCVELSGEGTVRLLPVVDLIEREDLGRLKRVRPADDDLTLVCVHFNDAVQKEEDAKSAENDDRNWKGELTVRSPSPFP